MAFSPKSWVVVEELTITVAATTIDIPGLDGDNDGAYLLEGVLMNNTASNSSYYLRLNGADVVGNRLYLSINPAYDAYRDTVMTLGAASAGNSGSFKLEFPISATGTDRYANSHVIRNNNATIFIQRYGLNISTPNSATNITSIGMRASSVDAIGIGSVIRLWRIK